MTAFLVVTAITLLAVAAILYVIRGRSAPVRSLDELTARSKPVDLEAFRNLVSVEEEAYLRESLPPRQFRRVQRKRMLAAAEYVRRASHNAALLVTLGESVRSSNDPQLAEAATELVNSAIQMRLTAILVLLCIGIRIVFPQTKLSLARLTDDYERLRGYLSAVGRLKAPADMGRIEAAL